MSVICPNCGVENEDGSTFCVVCGSKMDVQSTMSQGYQEQNYQDSYQQANPDRTNHGNINSGYVPTSDRIFLRIGNKLDTEDEYVVATLSNGVVRNIMTGDGIMSESIFVTNRRLYYIHNSGIFTKNKISERVDIKDITGTKIRNFSPNLLILIAILMLIGGYILDPYGNTGIVPMAIITAIVFVIVWAVYRRKDLLIQYAGGDIQLNVKGYSYKQVLKFQSIIHALKDQVEK